MKQSASHQRKMDRFHKLVDCELAGSITPSEQQELASLRLYNEELTNKTSQAIRERLALQEQVFRESMELVRGVSKATAAKTAKSGGRL